MKSHKLLYNKLYKKWETCNNINQALRKNEVTTTTTTTTTPAAAAAAAATTTTTTTITKSKMWETGHRSVTWMVSFDTAMYERMIGGLFLHGFEKVIKPINT